MMLQSFYSEMSSFAFDTTITVINKTIFKNFMSVIVKKMMNYPVSEMCCKHLSHLRVMDNETI